MSRIAASSFNTSCVAVLALASLTLVAAAEAGADEVTEYDSTRSGLASALATADYAREHCPRLRIDESALAPALAALDLSLETLREDPDYVDQAQAMASVHEGYGPEMACQGLPELTEYRADGLIRYR